MADKSQEINSSNDQVENVADEEKVYSANEEIQSSSATSLCPCEVIQSSSATSQYPCEEIQSSSATSQYPCELIRSSSATSRYPCLEDYPGQFGFAIEIGYFELVQSTNLQFNSCTRKVYITEKFCLPIKFKCEKPPRNISGFVVRAVIVYIDEDALSIPVIRCLNHIYDPDDIFNGLHSDHVVISATPEAVYEADEISQRRSVTVPLKINRWEPYYMTCRNNCREGRATAIVFTLEKLYEVYGRVILNIDVSDAAYKAVESEERDHFLTNCLHQQCPTIKRSLVSPYCYDFYGFIISLVELISYQGDIDAVIPTSQDILPSPDEEAHPYDKEIYIDIPEYEVSETVIESSPTVINETTPVSSNLKATPEEQMIILETLRFVIQTQLSEGEEKKIQLLLCEERIAKISNFIQTTDAAFADSSSRNITSDAALSDCSISNIPSDA